MVGLGDGDYSELTMVKTVGGVKARGEERRKKMKIKEKTKNKITLYNIRHTNIIIQNIAIVMM